MTLALLVATAAATAVGAAALHTVRGLRQQLSEISALRTELATSLAQHSDVAVPHARGAAESGVPAQGTDAIRAAVAEALAEERERELAEARAFWAAQEARDAADAPSLLGGLPAHLAEELFLPRQSDFVGLERELQHELAEPAEELSGAADEFPEDSPELAAARRRHPSHPDFVPVQPVRDGATGDHEHTLRCLEELAQDRTALSDVRPGPLGTLDVYVFTDGTTLCMTPGHRETAERLAAALRAGDSPVLLGGSGVSGAYTLTFGCGDENVYILADRVIASA
ncbi:hypothetical protein RCO28_33865 [Streptomyces sp. LHD-70]|uniref:hypothetical protein n=1 Tax=Streptomyces sp. LHD-70 TaxID=3072140 RepID=UPI00280F996F|nr:hypothetical protein [Streptomyces sp. LHD-70]MDQ8707418.1 hypothetical protein [Streptomyces sp. LHD-70]